MNKITNLDFKESSQKHKKELEKSNLKSYLGYDYIKMEKDVNGCEFSLSHLYNYADDVKYVISLARNIDNKAILYNFYISGDKLSAFFNHYLCGDIEGEIIEVDKMGPENLA